MADLDDVMTALTTTIAGVLYPNGIGSASSAGASVKVYPGWPVPNVLNTDLAAGKAHVSIFPRPEERNTTRYLGGYQTATVIPATLTATVSGATITIGGTVSLPQAVMAILNFGRSAYSYIVQIGDNLNTITAGLAALIPGATVNGVVITVTGALELKTQVITSGKAIKEVGRQERLFQLVIWAPTPAIRSAIARVVDAALRQTERFTLPDGSSARLIYKSSPMTDMLEKSAIYRRDLYYTVEYATTVETTFYTIGNVKAVLTPQESP